MTKTTLVSVIKSLKFDWMNDDIEKHFTYEKPRSSDYKLFHFDRLIESDEVVKEMEKERYSPATLSELLAYAKYEWNNEDWVVALGSFAEVCVLRRVPYIGRHGARRGLGLGWWRGRLDRHCRFLAVRISVPLTSETPTLSPSDTLTLEARVAALEEWKRQMGNAFDV